MLLAASTAAAQPVPTVSLEGIRPFRIGAPAGPPEVTFVSVAAAIALGDGRIAVLDRGANAIRYFDPAGRHLSTTGREGDGPGEFRDPTWLGACPDGVLLAIDPGLGRAALLSSEDGALRRHMILPAGIGYNSFLSCEVGGRALVLSDQDGRAGPPGEVARDPAAVVDVALESGAQDTLIRLDGTEYYYGASVPGFAPLPFGARALAAVGGGYLFAAQNGGEEVRVIELATGRRTAFRHGLPQARLTEEARQDAAADFVAEQPRERTRQLLTDVLAEAPPPEQYPRLMDLKADASGRVWLRLPPAGGTAVWHVHMPNGQHVASVRLPANVDPVDISATHLIVLERDELDIETILVYTLPNALLPAGR